VRIKEHQDFRTLTEQQLAEQLATSVAELEDHHTTDAGLRCIHLSNAW